MNVQGEVIRTYKGSGEDTSLVYILLKENKQIFMVSSSDFPDALFPEVGDKVSIQYKDTGYLNASVIDYKDENLK